MHEFELIRKGLKGKSGLAQHPAATVQSLDKPDAMAQKSVLP
ncbi:hypothetical protein [Rhodobacter sp. NTK016B]|nr:hypothetical protein [Rhodobacter sp. NTK016B]